jgi:hypothetical protein
MSVGAMKDYKLKLGDLRASHTLGWSWNKDKDEVNKRRSLRRVGKEEKKKRVEKKLYRLFLSPHSLSVTTVTLGSRLFFILLQINLLI